jgi:hypothetical protein
MPEERAMENLRMTHVRKPRGPTTE